MRDRCENNLPVIAKATVVYDTASNFGLQTK